MVVQNYGMEWLTVRMFIKEFAKILMDWRAFIKTLKLMSPPPVGVPAGRVRSDWHGRVAQYELMDTGDMYMCEGTCVHRIWFHVMGGLESMAVAQASEGGDAI